MTRPLLAPFQDGSTAAPIEEGNLSDATTTAVHMLLADMSVPDITSYMDDKSTDPPSPTSEDDSDHGIEAGAAVLAQSMLNFLDDDALSEEEEIERSEGARTPDEQLFGDDNDNGSRKRTRSDVAEQNVSAEWYPWPNKIGCTIDILMNLPRSVFSQRQLDIFLWVLAVNDIRDTPSASSVLRLQTVLQTMCGIRTLSYKGVLGHNYSVNSLADMIAQEMANPRVRPHLQFYPEDNGKSVNEYWQASHWLEEADPTKLTPLAIVNDQHFFVFEPCLLRDGRTCMPVRWFKRCEIRSGKKVDILYAKAWLLGAAVSDTCSGWIVDEFDSIEVSQDDLLISFGVWQSSGSTQGLPPATSILGFKECADGELKQWTMTNAAEGNRWRGLANGSRVYSFPIWLYCDDTSGNLSKKWNAHNSFLFTPAGLPRSRVHNEYNVHFLCTSNSAPPLEMDAWENGIWAWDEQHNERVLVIPFVVALLGDNPMQSELSCHIGLGGKFFCRVCKVSSESSHVTAVSAVMTSVAAAAHLPSHADTQRNPSSDDGHHSEEDEEHRRLENLSDNESIAGSAASAAGSATAATKKTKIETMAGMLDRVKRFVKIGPLRKKEQSVDELKSMFTLASSVGNVVNIKTRKTETGLKDKALDSFMERLHASYKKLTGGLHRKQTALDAYIATLPPIEKMMSPVWRIKVEVLHVVLLGFVKYFWRDAIHNQLKTDNQKELLITRLNSLDTSGLGLAKMLAGRTLVQYAGSLTGRDFRAIAQVAPFVLYGLVPPKCYDAWLSLSALVPLIWQPEIPDIDAHLRQLTVAVKNFLAATARWTPQAFESFNAVIRAQSVHSNRQAPSFDIAKAFAHGNRIRHLLSGGFIRERRPESRPVARSPSLSSSFHVADSVWRKAGTAALQLVATRNVMTGYLGLNERDQTRWGHVIPDSKTPACTFHETLSGQRFPDSMQLTPAELKLPLCKTSKAMVLLNGDSCPLGQYILYRSPGAARGSVPLIGCVREILQQVTTVNFRQSMPDAILVQRYQSTGNVDPYNMPGVMPEEEYDFLPPQNILCTANVQHQCAKFECEDSAFVFIRQERQLSDQTRPVIEHKEAQHLVLNTARMRDAVHMNLMYNQVDPQTIDHSLEEAVTAGVAAVIDARKNNTANDLDRAPNRGRGRSHGRGRGRGRGTQRDVESGRGRGLELGRGHGHGHAGTGLDTEGA
ncbi:hypothetical protein EUX98_g8870 [Antrodiella citrinella]|uniref:Uncharacterized protein n=1 Tax=Antrodiella citrinella TaxID=2447956 RepID=A0A4S4M1K5_9APHY|nr:hypothetical protein EUX98_g8870 [Antrodiella citrinella]